MHTNASSCGCPVGEFIESCTAAANETILCTTARTCDRGDLVPAELQHFFAAHTCDGYPDCASLEDEFWSTDATTGSRGDACPDGSVTGLAAAATTLGCLACALTLLCAFWSRFQQKEMPEVYPMGSAYVIPLLVASAAGSIVTIILGVSVGRFSLTGLTVVQCVAGPVLAASWTVILATLTVRVFRTVQGASLPLQQQAEFPSPGQACRAQLPALTTVGLLALPYIGLAVAGYGWTARFDSVLNRVHCSCGAAAWAPDVLLVIHMVISSLWMLSGIILSCCPARHITRKLHFYPWMQHCHAANKVLYMQAIAALAVLASGFSVTVLLSLPRLWEPLLHDQHDLLRAKRRRVTTLHDIVSGSKSPVVADRGTNTLAQGRFPNLRRKLGLTGEADGAVNHDDTENTVGTSSGTASRYRNQSMAPVVPPRDLGPGAMTPSPKPSGAGLLSKPTSTLTAGTPQGPVDSHVGARRDAASGSQPITPLRPEQKFKAAAVAALMVEKMSLLLRRADALGVDQDELDDAEDSSDDPTLRKQAVAEVIVNHQMATAVSKEAANTSHDNETTRLLSRGQEVQRTHTPQRRATTTIGSEQVNVELAA